MNTKSLDVIDITLAERLISIPSESWTPKISYLVSREMVDNEILEGNAFIGTLRKQVFETYCEGRKSFAIQQTNYGWVQLKNGFIVDPCRIILHGNKKTLKPVENIGQFYNGLDPLNITTDEIPVHYNSDELFPVLRGKHKEVLSRLLGFKVEVSGLTMIEAAYIANLSLDGLGTNRKLVYEFLIRSGLTKLIPYKNVKVVFPQMAASLPEVFCKVTE